MEGQSQLSEWACYLQDRYPELSSSLHPGFVLFWKPLKSWGEKNVGLEFLPDFYLVLKKSEREREEEKFCMNLITFHGKILDTLLLDNDGKVPQSVDKILDEFPRLTMCKGVEFHHNEGEFLVEHFNDNLVVRSKTCTYSAAKCGSKKRIVCRNCEKMATASKTTKIKPEPPEEEEEEWYEETKDVGLTIKYENNSDEEEMVTLKYENDSDEEEMATMAFEEDLSDYEEEKPLKVKTHHKQIKRGRPKHSNLAKKKTKVAFSDKEKKPFKAKCKICLYTFKNEHSYREDQDKHEKFFDMNCSVTCPLCSNAMAKVELTSHFQEKHNNNDSCTEEKKLTCCCECLEVMPDKKNYLKRHIMRKHYGPVCDTCGKRYSSTIKLQMHIRSFHMDKKDLLCDNCGKAFGHPQSLKSHKRVVCNQAENWPCRLCDKVFAARVKLGRHLAMHSKCRPYKCKYCDYRTYKTSNIIPVHLKKLHGKKSGTVQDIVTLEDELDRMKNFLNLHMDGLEIVQKKKEFKQKQKQQNQIKYSTKQSLKCPLCEKTYSSEETIRCHFYIHSTFRPYQCKHCDFKSYKSTLVNSHHYKKVHGQGLPGRVEDVQVDLEELANMKAFATEQLILVERMKNK